MTRTALLISATLHFVLAGVLWMSWSGAEAPQPTPPRPAPVIQWVEESFAPREVQPQHWHDRELRELGVGPGIPETHVPPSVPELQTTNPAEAAAKSTTETNGAAELPGLARRRTMEPQRLRRAPAIPQPTRAAVTLEGETAPQLASEVSPVYPRECRAKRHEGVVELTLEINAAGRVTGVRIAKPSRCRHMDRAAVDAAWDLRYTPSQLDGVAVPGSTTLLVRFRLR